MPQVQVIEPIRHQRTARLRVCAYARVSSDSEDQQHSFAAQVRYYTTLIANHEDWEFVDIYADEGITGTRADKREDFQRMMQDCRDGKIDRILVKSLSRFARNTQDCIAAVRELKQLGVTVVFEKEHLNTGTMANEMFLSMMSAFAQEESISISQNMRKGARMRMENGTYQLSVAPYGYRLDDNHNLVIEPAGAAIVREIFRRFLDGDNTKQIADDLPEKSVPKLKNQPVWSKKGVVYILTNERYTGDECYQKFISTQSIPYKQVLNKGKQSKFYLENTHEKIIDRDTFNKAQALLSLKRNRYGHSQSERPAALSGMIECRCCGSKMYRKVNDTAIRWVCSKHLSDTALCHTQPISEQCIWNMFRKMISKISQNDCELLVLYLEMMNRIINKELAGRADHLHIQREISGLLNKQHMLERLKSSGCIDMKFYLAQRNQIDNQLTELHDKKGRMHRKIDGVQTIEETKQIIRLLGQRSTMTKQDLLHRTVKKIVADRMMLSFEMRNGLVFSEPLGEMQ